MRNIDDVVRKGLCIGCGVCAYSDAIGQTEYSARLAQHVPVITRKNRDDAVAFDVCPGKGYDIVASAEALYGSANYDVDLGRCYGQYAAVSNDKTVMRNASSGGVMSQIAIFLLERDIVDRVLTTEFTYASEPRTLCTLARSRADILRSQGSKYCPVDLSGAIREVKENHYRVAVIGTPCQIAGIRNIQRQDQAFGDKIVLTIGNFCGGIKSYKNISLLAQRQGIAPSKIEFFRFRGNGQPGTMLIQEDSGRQAEIPYPKYVGLTGLSKHLRCHLCVDATGELADIACGDAWLPRFLHDPNPWSIIITRSKRADDLVNAMIAARVLSVSSVTREEIKLSQHENLRSKKVRQKSRYRFYRALGFTIPSFDGGYHDTRTDLWTEARVFAKHQLKQLLEALHLFSAVHRLVKGR